MQAGVTVIAVTNKANESALPDTQVLDERIAEAGARGLLASGETLLKIAKDTGVIETDPHGRWKIRVSALKRVYRDIAYVTYNLPPPGWEARAKNLRHRTRQIQGRGGKRQERHRQPREGRQGAKNHKT